MAIKIENLRIIPYTQKNIVKPVFGDTMTLTFTLPDTYQAGDEYTLGLDYERILIPTAREICALTDDFTISENDITFNLLISTARFRDWVSSIKKPMPIWLQIQRKRNNIYETILLDDVLALPSIIDGENTVFHGDPLEDLLAQKLDKPEVEGEEGNVLKLGSDGLPVWGEGEGATSWDDITGKPSFATVASTGNYNDLTSKPNFANVASTGNYNDLTSKPNFASVAYTGNYNDLISKPTFASVAYTGNYEDLSSKPTIPTVNNATITFVQGGISKGAFSLNQATDSTISLDAGGSAGAVDWADITNKPTFATVASTGNYEDLTSKPEIITISAGGSAVTSIVASHGATISNVSGLLKIDVAVANSVTSNGLSPVNAKGIYYFVQGEVSSARSELNSSISTLDSSVSAITESKVDSSNLASVAYTGSYEDLINTPSLASVAYTGSYEDLISTPTFATVASTGDYNDLLSKPTIPDVYNATITITQGGVSKGVFTLNQSADSTIALDAGGGGGGSTELTISQGTITNSTITISPSADTCYQYTVSTPCAIDAAVASAGKVQYAEIVVDVASGASVQEGSNISFKDTISDNARNVCIARWYGTSARVYVVDKQDFPS